MRTVDLRAAVERKVGRRKTVWGSGNRIGSGRAGTPCAKFLRERLTCFAA